MSSVNPCPEFEGIHEWNAWKLICRILKNRGLDINEDMELTQAIANWGYKLQLLRHKQGSPELTPLFYSAEATAKLEEKYPEFDR